MNLQNCIKFANENPVCYLATTEGDQPRVRGLLMWFANEDGFYFATLSPKEMSQQLKQNPKVEVCFYNNPSELSGAKQMRLTGKAEFVNDEALKKRITEERKFLESLVGKPLGPLWEIFRIHAGEAHFWTLPDALKEPQLERIKF